MATVTGTSDISVLLAARFQSVADFGLDNITEVLNRDLDAHNRIMVELVGGLCEVTTDRQRIYGSSVDGELQEVDEYGQAPSQTPTQGSTVAFPLRKYQFNLGWTTRWMAKATPADVAEKVLAAQKAHRRRVERQIRRAIFQKANFTFKDHLVDNVDLAVKKFLNADGAPIPNSPQDGASFAAATHDHYNFSAALDNAAVDALIEDVLEHSLGADIKIGINRADEQAWRALTQFVPYSDSRLEVFRNSTASDVPFVRLDQSVSVNRAIGLFGAAEVLVKSWVPALYAACWDNGWAKPLAFRQDDVEQFQGLSIAADQDEHPLRAQFMEAMFGVGVWERTAMAVLFFNDTSYTDPVIT